jgi:lipopolysaccharide/colanic/teichoic acid biosynthesis glycosyltransferase
MSRGLTENGPVAETAPAKARAGDSISTVPLWYRGFEIAVAIAVLVLTLPLLAVIAVLVRRGTPGPALFRQRRLAAGARPFMFYKFRTHYVDASERFPAWCAYQYREDELEAVRLQVEDDPRVTPQGKWLRRSSLDELPNFWHVITGDMALVGPRPEMVEMLPYYKDEQRRKFSVRPGITGLAQVSGRGNLTFTETVKLDLEYVRTRSLANDLRILLRTFLMVIKADGAL